MQINFRAVRVCFVCLFFAKLLRHRLLSIFPNILFRENICFGKWFSLFFAKRRWLHVLLMSFLPAQLLVPFSCLFFFATNTHTHLPTQHNWVYCRSVNVTAINKRLIRSERGIYLWIFVEIYFYSNS